MAVPSEIDVLARELKHFLKGRLQPGVAFMFQFATPDHGGGEGWVYCGGTVPEEGIAPILRELADKVERALKDGR